jgi:hypothetical protein
VSDVSGVCPALQFSLKNTLVRTTAATNFSKGPCKDVRNGKEVELKGDVQPDGSVTATSVEVKK